MLFNHSAITVNQKGLTFPGEIADYCSQIIIIHVGASYHRCVKIVSTGTPGQATSYLVGQQVIIEARENAEEKLGKKFDIRNFHYQILSQGHATLTFIKKYMEHYSNCKSGEKDSSCQHMMSKDEKKNFVKKSSMKSKAQKLNKEIMSLIKKRIYY